MRGTLLQPAMPDYQRVASQGPKNFGALVALACVGWKVKCLIKINIYIFQRYLHIEYIWNTLVKYGFGATLFLFNCLLRSVRVKLYHHPDLNPPNTMINAEQDSKTPMDTTTVSKIFHADVQKRINQKPYLIPVQPKIGIRAHNVALAVSCSFTHVSMIIEF